MYQVDVRNQSTDMNDIEDIEKGLVSVYLLRQGMHGVQKSEIMNDYNVTTILADLKWKKSNRKAWGSRINWFIEQVSLLVNTSLGIIKGHIISNHDIAVSI